MLIDIPIKWLNRVHHLKIIDNTLYRVILNDKKLSLCNFFFAIDVAIREMSHLLGNEYWNLTKSNL